MISFFVCIIVLIVGYLLYGELVEKVFEPNDKLPTPAIREPDGVDYVPLSTWKAFLIQLLNIAGLGPIFGAISGAMWGPCVYLWIVGGTILAGGVHDFFSGMLSERNDGASISEVTGKYLGPVMHNVMRVFSIVLLELVGVVFMVGPAGLLALLTPSWLSIQVWTVIILVYYFLATFLPVDKIIGKVYPLFGILLIVMALGVGVSTIVNSGTRPMMEITLKNLYPSSGMDGVTGVKPIWPLMFITVACGAISGFHATQSPIISRCIKNEKDGRKIFYGAMVAEGVIALIWAAAAVAFFYDKDGSGTGLKALLEAKGGNSTTVYNMCVDLLGKVGAVLALLGVIVCPITSGDTAFRSARMTIFNWFKLDEKSIKNRLMISAPLLLIGYGISFINYNVVWRYFSWANQTLAMIVLWAASVYLATNYGKNPNRCWLTALPATFMSAVSITYLFYAPECFNLGSKGHTGMVVSYVVGAVVAVIFLALFLLLPYSHREKSLARQQACDISRKAEAEARKARA